MSRINNLIKTLCPNGAQYKKLEDLVDYIQPSKYIVKSTNYNNKYDIPVLTAGQTFILGFTDEQEGVYYASKDKPVIIFDDFTTSNHWVDFKFKVKSSAMKILVPKTSDDFKYIYYCISNIDYHPKEHSRQWIQTFSQFAIPIPPLEVQEEIVKILDKFGKLEAELEAELEARKSQYEFWRGKLLNTKTATEYKLKDLVDLYLGLTYTPNYVDSGIKFISSLNISKDYLNLSNVKYITKEEFDNCTSNAKPKKGDVLYVRVGSNLGHPVIYDLDEDICIFVSVGFARVKNNNILFNRYLRHWMSSDMFMNQVKAKTKNAPKANLNATWMKEFTIFVPPLEEQQKIVNILDKFNKLVNDISVGLPAEIEARRKQYEYYRNKLLSFEEVSCE